MIHRVETLYKEDAPFPPLYLHDSLTTSRGREENPEISVPLLLLCKDLCRPLPVDNSCRLLLETLLSSVVITGSPVHCGKVRVKISLPMSSSNLGSMSMFNSGTVTDGMTKVW